MNKQITAEEARVLVKEGHWHHIKHIMEDILKMIECMAIKKHYKIWHGFSCAQDEAMEIVKRLRDLGYIADLEYFPVSSNASLHISWKQPNNQEQKTSNTEWISVDDELPPINKLVILQEKPVGDNTEGYAYFGARLALIDGWKWARSFNPPLWDRGQWRSSEMQCDDFQIMCWRDIPEPPKEGGCDEC